AYKVTGVQTCALPICGVRLHLLPAAVRHLRRSASSSAILGYSGSGDDLLGVTDERCCQIGRSATSAMRGELQQRGRPVPAEPGRIDEVIDFFEEHGDSALRGALILWLIHLPAGGGAQHPGVDLDRSLPKGVPIDHAR